LASDLGSLAFMKFQIEAALSFLTNQLVSSPLQACQLKTSAPMTHLRARAGSQPYTKRLSMLAGGSLNFIEASFSKCL